ncbi:hypothetical protein AALO_G00053080 [Alosa alosa]|uniref:Uncharacterized protein n=1 Tax=Alosa alosa TaxID=278164 RepID=A0AAV6H4W6_9TELE|nr:ABC transporter F family member 4-like isoform X1 [Alosa alosa]KAG5282180.1 hypothetical protein AALO_G00053080 [Alosa alosa]
MILSVFSLQEEAIYTDLSFRLDLSQQQMDRFFSPPSVSKNKLKQLSSHKIHPAVDQLSVQTMDESDDSHEEVKSSVQTVDMATVLEAMNHEKQLDAIRAELQMEPVVAEEAYANSQQCLSANQFTPSPCPSLRSSRGAETASSDTDTEGSTSASTSQEEDYEQPTGYYNKYQNLLNEAMMPPPAPSPLSYTLSDFSDSSEDGSDCSSVSSEESFTGYDTSDSDPPVSSPVRPKHVPDREHGKRDSDPPVSSPVRPKHVPDREHGKRDEKQSDVQTQMEEGKPRRWQIRMEERELKRQTKGSKPRSRADLLDPQELQELRERWIQRQLEKEATLKQKFLKWLPKVKPGERNKFKYVLKPPGRISIFIDKCLKMRRLGEGRTKKKKKKQKSKKKEGNEEDEEVKDKDNAKYEEKYEEDEEEEEEEEAKKPGFFAKLLGKKKKKKDINCDQEHLEEETGVSGTTEEEREETALATKRSQKKPGFLSKLFGKRKNKRKGYQEQLEEEAEWLRMTQI